MRFFSFHIEKKWLAVFLGLLLCALGIYVAARKADDSSGGRAKDVPPGYVLKFSDDFNGTSLDRTKWNYRTDRKAGSQQIPANISLKNGILTIKGTCQKNGSAPGYNGGGIVSKTAFKYGYYESRLKMTSQKGWHSSFWLYAGNGSTTFNPSARTEIDAIEWQAEWKKYILQNVYEWKNKTIVKTFPGSGRLPLSFDPAAGYHIYAMLYTSTDVKFYMDGDPERTISYPSGANAQDNLNIWLSVIGKGNPAAMNVDYIKYYAPA